MSIDFKQKCVLITGAASGIGRALCLQLLSLGAKVCVCGRDYQKLELLQAEAASGNLWILKADVSKEEDCRQFIEYGLKMMGSIDVLINNAGISMRALFQDLDLEVLRRSMDINFWGTVYCCKYALPPCHTTK